MNRTAAATMALFTLMVIGPASALEARAGPSRSEAPYPGTKSLQEIWRTRADSLQEGQPQKAQESEALLRQWQRQNGAARVVELAGAFVLEGYEDLSQNRISRARKAFSLALQFDPNMSRAHLGLARVAWESGEGLWAVLGQNLQAASALWRSRQERSVLVHHALWALTMGIPAGVGVLCFLLFLRVGRLVHHGLAAILNTRLPPTTAWILALLIPWLPLAVPAGRGWLPLFWILLAAPYLSRLERASATAALLAVAVCGGLAAPLVRSTSRAADPLLLDAAAAAEGSVSPGGEKSLARLLEKAPDDAALQFFYAGQSRGLGHHIQALRAYRRAAELDPQLSQASNNLGILLASLGREARAVQAFHQAIAAAPSDLTAYYNLYLTQQHRFDFEAAERTLAQAQSVDLTGITSLLSSRTGHQARLDLIEARLPVRTALQHARKAMAHEQTATGLWSVLPGWAWPFILMPLGTLFLFLTRWHRPGWPVPCRMCGRITCKHCALDSGRRSRCASCQALAGHHVSLPRTVRKRKRAAIAAYQRRKARTGQTLGLLLPGAGQIWAGRTVMGSLLLITACTASLALLVGPSLPVAPHSFLQTGLSASSLAAILVLLCTWFAGWILPLSPLEPTQAFSSRPRRR